MARDQEIQFIVLHGFLGDNQSFASLKEWDVQVSALSLRPSKLNFPTWSELLDFVEQELNKYAQIPHRLMAYSMGGRVLIELLDRLDLTHCKKINFISSHVGQYVGDEVAQRMRFNQECLTRLDKQSAEEFLNFWNQLPLFAWDDPCDGFDWSLQEMKHFFQHWTPASQLELNFDEHTQSLITHSYGQYDEKYKEQARRLKQKCRHIQIQEIKGRSHRLLQLDDLRQIAQLD